jgi:hypothetical protein
MALGPEPSLNRASGVGPKGNLTVGAPCASCSGKGAQGNPREHQNYGASSSHGHTASASSTRAQ